MEHGAHAALAERQGAGLVARGREHQQQRIKQLDHTGPNVLFGNDDRKVVASVSVSVLPRYSNFSNLAMLQAHDQEFWYVE